MPDAEGGHDPGADLEGLDQLLASSAEPLGGGDDDATEFPGHYVRPSRRLTGGSRPLPIDTSRLGDEGRPPLGAPASGRTSGPMAMTVTGAGSEVTEVPAGPGPPEDAMSTVEVVSTGEVGPAGELADAPASEPTVAVSAPAPVSGHAEPVHRGPRWHPPPVVAPPPSVPLDMAGLVASPTTEPASVSSWAPSAPSAPPREVPTRRAHPRVRRWFGRDKVDRAGEGESAGAPAGES